MNYQVLGWILIVVLALSANFIIIYNEELVVALGFFVVIFFAFFHQNIIKSKENVIQSMLDDLRHTKKAEFQKNLIDNKELYLIPAIKKLNYIRSYPKSVQYAKTINNGHLHFLSQSTLTASDFNSSKQINQLLTTLMYNKRSVAENALKYKKGIINRIRMSISRNLLTNYTQKNRNA